MDEEKSTKENVSEEAEKFKNETKETVNQVKDSIRNTNFKEDTKATTNFVKDLFMNPFEEIRNVAVSEENFIGKDVILVIAMVIASAIGKFIGLFRGGSFVTFLFSIITPLLFILVQVVSIYIVSIINKTKKKSMITILSTVIVVSIPQLCIYLMYLLNNLITGVYIIWGPIISTLIAVRAIFQWVGYKELFDEEDDKKFFVKFLEIEAITFFIIQILIHIGIYN